MLVYYAAALIGGILYGITAAVGIFLIVFSIKHAAISVVNTNTEIAGLLTSVIIGIIILNERRGVINKMIGSVFCITGIILLNFF